MDIMIVMKTIMKEMPKNCLECWMIECDCIDKKEDGETPKEYHNERHKDCPLIEIN